MSTLPKLLIIGHGRHGKDTVCDILTSMYGFTFISSSQFCSNKFMYDMLKTKYNYTSEEECYNDRHNHREEWYNGISEYNGEDPVRLGKEIFQEYDIYCGLRNKKEFYAMAAYDVFNYVIWVDRSKHVPPEDSSSMTLDESMADFVIDNNGDLGDLYTNVNKLMERLLKSPESNLLDAKEV